MVAIVVGGEEDFNAVLYGAQKHPGTVDYLRNQVYGMAQQFGGMMSGAVGSFVERAQSAFEAVNGSEAVRRARAAIDKASAIFQQDMIRSLNTLVEIQQAPLLMQRWIMAEPTMRSLYHKQRCDGYSDTYMDVSPGDVGVNHYDYRRVMDGQVSLFVNEDGEEDWMRTHYLDEYEGTDTRMQHDDQNAIRHTWHHVRAAVKRLKEDPTSSHGGLL